MPTVQVKTQLSLDELLKAVGQLSLPELEHFAQQVIALWAKRKAPALPQAEAELLLKINQGLPNDLQRRYNELIAKRQAETLTSDENRELLRLTDHAEKLEASRVECMAELARIRNTSLDALMKELGIQAPAYA